MNNGDKPAYPVEVEHYEGKISGMQTGNTTGFEMGLSKRERFAMAAMQGILASRELQKCLIHDAKHNGDTADNCIAAFAVRQADELLKQLES